MDFPHSGTYCRLCPRECGADRTRLHGYCGVSDTLRVSRVGLHLWEEPCISYGKGSGTVFFAGCNLRCVFCQNHEISVGTAGKDIDVKTLADEFLHLRDMGAVNINLVTPTQFADKIVMALDRVIDTLGIPVVYNCGGYEKEETLRMLSPYIDIFLPDFKYVSSELSAKYSGAADYFTVAARALDTMYDIAGYAVFNEEEHMTRGVLTRHLVLPGAYKDSLALLDYLASHYDPSRFAVSLMSQYFPTAACKNIPPLNRRLTSLEYDKVISHAEELGFSVGYTQDRRSAKEEYVPSFDYKKECDKP